MNNLITKALSYSDIDSLVHIGGHIGQEVDFYQTLNLKQVIFFEPVEEFAKEILDKIDGKKNFVLNKYALGSQDSEKLIYIADKGVDDDSGSTSLLQPRESKISFSNKKLIEVKKYSNFNYSNIDIAVLDTQGYELEVLRGFEEKLNSFKFIVTEFSNFEGYFDQVLYKNLNKFLNKNNFSLIFQNKKIMKVFPNKQGGSYGDALYINNLLISKKKVLQNSLRYKFLNNYIYDFLSLYLNLKFWKSKLKIILR